MWRGVALGTEPARAQANFDRPGGDYTRVPVLSGDPAECALTCERDRRCRAWSFRYPEGRASAAVCWLKGTVPQRVASDCCVSGVRGAGVVERQAGPLEMSIDRLGGDYRSFEVKGGNDAREAACREACEADKECRAFTYVRPGYIGGAPRCFLKNDIKPPRRRPCCISGVVR